MEVVVTTTLKIGRTMLFGLSNPKLHIQHLPLSITQTSSILSVSVVVTIPTRVSNARCSLVQSRPGKLDTYHDRPRESRLWANRISCFLPPLVSCALVREHRSWSFLSQDYIYNNLKNTERLHPRMTTQNPSTRCEQACTWRVPTKVW